MIGKKWQKRIASTKKYLVNVDYLKLILGISLLSFFFSHIGQHSFAEISSAKIRPSLLSLPANKYFLEKVRVEILDNQKEITIYLSSTYTIKTIETDELLHKGNTSAGLRIVPVKNGIKLGGQVFKIYGIKIATQNSVFELNRKKYRDGLQVIRKDNGQLLVINEINREDYLKGVLPWEVSPQWPLEALKAQAVASRTFALFKNIEHMGKDFSLRAGEAYQLYGGKSLEQANCDRAIELTQGEILLYQGQIFPAYFHATCAGDTTQAESIWHIQPLSVLWGVKCGYCQKSKHYKWSETLKLKDLTKKFKEKGYKIGQIQGIVPLNWDGSGRARLIQLNHSKGKLTLNSNDFRLLVGPALVRSTNQLKVRYKNGKVIFSGLGWGHGVGLCQWGAKGMAEQGYNYKEILWHYYPGAEIHKLEPAVG